MQAVRGACLARLHAGPTCAARCGTLPFCATALHSVPLLLLVQILSYHFLPGKKLTSKGMSRVQILPTLLGANDVVQIYKRCDVLHIARNLCRHAAARSD